MKMALECVPCFLRQTLNAIKFSSQNDEVGEKVLREVLKEILSTSWNITPPFMAHRVHGVIRRIIGGIDPYKEVKEESNRLAMEFYKEMAQRIRSSKDPILEALMLSAAANVIDFGAREGYNLKETLDKMTQKGFYVNHYDKLRRDLKKAKSTLFFADNSGEIAFDRLLIETIIEVYPLKKISFVVKGGPILNDATLKDVYEVGLDRIENIDFLLLGNGEEGSGPERSSNEVYSWIKNHDITISKGQGNFEGLSEFKGVYYIMMVKCKPVSRFLGIPENEMILKYV